MHKKSTCIFNLLKNTVLLLVNKNMASSDCGNISASELDQETRQKLKGDVIGDTLYSESFVLKTLLQLSDVKWGEDIENDLCFLWDMTLESDVCKYLFQLNYPSIACTAVSKNGEGRFIEIVIGILANMLIVDCEKNITEKEIKTILQELNTDDTAVLIQLMRFTEGVAFVYEKLQFITEIEINKIIFILTYSTNNELLTYTFQVVAKLLDNFKLDECLVTAELYEAVITGFDTLFHVEESDLEIDSEDKNKCIKNFLYIVTNLCSYVEKFGDQNLSLSISSCPKCNVTIIKILKYFSNEENLLPDSKDFTVYMGAFLEIFSTEFFNLNDNFFYETFRYICKILYLLQKCKIEVLDTFNVVLELLAYLVFNIEKDIVLGELKKLSYNNGIVVLNCLKENVKSFEFDILDKLKYFFIEYK